MNAPVVPIRNVTRYRHGQNVVVQEAVGAISAQKAVELIQGGALVELAWLKFDELAAAHDWRSAACRAFVCELAKRQQTE